MSSRPQRLRAAAAISGILWVWSWRTMYLEIHRWKHVTRSLRFNPGPPFPGTNIRPKPGRPLKALYVCSVGAPVAFVATVIAARIERNRGRGHGHGLLPLGDAACTECDVPPI